MTQSGTESWFYSQNGQQLGPVTADALRQLLSSGQVRREDPVWSEGMAAWTPAGQVAALVPPGARAAPPPLPAQPVAYYTAPPPGLQGGPSTDPALRWLVPVGRSGWAIAAGYLGLFSVLIIVAPIALIVSIIAIRDIRKHPGRHGMGRAVFGLIMGALFSVGFVVWVIAMVA